MAFLGLRERARRLPCSRRGYGRRSTHRGGIYDELDQTDGDRQDRSALRAEFGKPDVRIPESAQRSRKITLFRFL